MGEKIIDAKMPSQWKRNFGLQQGCHYGQSSSRCRDGMKPVQLNFMEHV